ncbi:MAG: ATP-binding protein, partial [Bacteroidota bacterium]
SFSIFRTFNHNKEALVEESFNPWKINLTNCDLEPIHIPGYIQGFGALIAADAQSHQVLYVSENLFYLLDCTPKSLPIYLSDLLELEEYNQLLASPDYPFEISRRQQSLLLMPHEYQGLHILDFEPLLDKENSAHQFQQRIGKVLNQLHLAPNVDQLCQELSQHVHQLLGYDRVMIYKFDQFWNGQVIAEARRDHLEPYLGLHYPASDIPRPAREMFLKHRVRLIQDIQLPAYSVQALDQERKDQHLDLSHSQLRGVSPIHIEYLQNMGVRASLTISIIVNGKLWGLIACHHQEPKFVGYHMRESTYFMGQVFATLLLHKVSQTDLARTNSANQVRSQLIEQISKNRSIQEGLRDPQQKILELNTAQGVAIILENQSDFLGTCPDESAVEHLLHWLNNSMEEEVFFTDCLSDQYHLGKEIRQEASGILAIRIHKDPASFIIWFKPEQTQKIKWAGKPSKQGATPSDDTPRQLSPRKSFQQWEQEIRGYSLPWEEYEVQAARAFRENIINIIIAKYDEIKALNEKLQKANQELETFSYSISHDLRAPLRAVDGYAHILKEDYMDSLDAFGQKTIKSIIEGTKRMNGLIDDMLRYAGLGNSIQIINSFEVLPVFEEIKADLLIENSERAINLKVAKNLPPIVGDRPMVQQLLYNILANAVKYTRIRKQAEIELSFVPNTNPVVYFVKDNGIGISEGMFQQIFDMFTRSVGKEYEGSGIGLALVKRIVERHRGEVWVESELGKGATFFFYLNYDSEKTHNHLN